MRSEKIHSDDASENSPFKREILVLTPRRLVVFSVHTNIHTPSAELTIRSTFQVPLEGALGKATHVWSCERHTNNNNNNKQPGTMKDSGSLYVDRLNLFFNQIEVFCGDSENEIY